MKSTIILLACVLMNIIACKNIDELQKDPNAITNPHPQLILTGLLLDMRSSPWGGDQQNNQYMVINEAYYGNQSYAWGAGSTAGYNQLRNVVRLEAEAEKKGEEGKPYLALAKFFKAYFFTEMTVMLGELPLGEALKGPTEGIFQPKFDTQEAIYKQCLLWLEEANADITPLAEKKATVGGDFYFKGNMKNWQLLINSYRLRLLISLSKRAIDAPNLKVREQFAEIVNNPAKYPLILENTDNFKLVYNSASRDNNYPLWPADGVVVKRDLRNHIGDTYLSILSATKDPRIFVVATPTDSAKNSGDPGYAARFTSFRGGKTGELQTTLKDQAVNGKLSNINFDYWVSSPSGVPYIMFGAAETSFTIAEAINRGWVAGDAAAYYKKGITLSMKTYSISDNDIAQYFLADPTNNYAGDNVNGLNQILKQKYVAFFQNSGREAYYNYRRTGVPAFHIGPANENNNQIPVRWAYPTSEYTTNEVNLKASLQQQYNGSDTRNDVMWLVK
ncbi:SusD/RagB family nutrient-binding outer membrane lipoprotein [Chitinophaga sp. SYP-B3965]|uniref:SusD/RagB family nutrient-binding outer membrane lipoprotein n=1 Tax=Chitinophaga sp. SYP-B3965 TaxID=2663120 RepID=UPI001299824C|nr:SusD/RagB family nutrient-binding outer membrane lipoprotein [Chitinophaga sp. SYP-B3965]MRG47309.1 SusD/RagB family nutrient-binding outer membrane lipoprotein [Chitinophaga sp. SYP-B3965]